MKENKVEIKKVSGFISDCPEYDVFLAGVNIGKVYKGWWRLGGSAWSHSARPTFHSGFTTRSEAVANLIKKAGQS